MDWWWAYPVLGAVVGLLSGLLGIGGGAAMVPVLAFIFKAVGFAPDHVVHLALGTSIASILFTSASSVRSHHLRRAVNWGAVRIIAPSVMAGTLGGALLAGYVDARTSRVQPGLRIPARPRGDRGRKHVDRAGGRRPRPSLAGPEAKARLRARSLWPCDEHAGELVLGVLHIDGSA